MPFIGRRSMEESHLVRSSVDLLHRLLDPCQRRFPSQHLQRLKQRRGVLASADGYSNGLKHLPGFQAEFLGGGAQGLVERVVLELRLRQDFTGSGQRL